MNFLPADEKAQIFTFYWFVLSKRQIAWTKNFKRSLTLWHWMAMKSLGKNLIVVSKSGPQKLVIQCHKMKLLWNIFVRAICLLDENNNNNKKTIKFENSIISCLLDKNSPANFWEFDLETMIQFLLRLIMAFQCHKIKLLWKFSVEVIYFLDKRNQKKNKQKKEISTLLPLGKKFSNFLWADLETRIQYLPKLFIILQYHKMKLLWNVLVQIIYL